MIPSLFWRFVLDYELRKKGDPHNCVDDAFAAMKLVLVKIKHGFEYACNSG